MQICECGWQQIVEWVESVLARIAFGETRESTAEALSRNLDDKLSFSFPVYIENETKFRPRRRNAYLKRGGLTTAKISFGYCTLILFQILIRIVRFSTDTYIKLIADIVLDSLNGVLSRERSRKVAICESTWIFRWAEWMRVL